MKLKKILAGALAIPVLLSSTLAPSDSPFPGGFIIEASAASNSKLKAPEEIATSATKTSIKLKWEEVAGADAYRVYKYDSSEKKYVKYKTVSTPKCTIKELLSGTKYKFKIAVVIKKNGKYYSQNYTETISVTTEKLDAPKDITATADSSSITLKWKKVSEADAYRVYQYDATKKKYVKTEAVPNAITETTCTITGLTAGTTYKFKIAALVKNGNKYSVQKASSAVTKATVSNTSNGGNTTSSTGSTPSYPIRPTYPTNPTTYTVTFVTNGGSSVVSQTVSSGSSATKPTDPSLEGYVFRGWYTDETCTATYSFTSAVTANITLYAKWVAEATDYYENNSKLIEIIPAAESNDVLNETEAKARLAERGFGEGIITYDFTISGERVDRTEISDNAANKHPVYKTYYNTPNEETWIVYIINGSIIAYPISFNLESDLGAELIFSESDTITSYDDATNQFYVTIPNDSATIAKTVNRIDAATLSGLTIEEVCRLSGATVPVPVSVTEVAYNSEPEPYPLDDTDPAATAFVESRSSDPIIVVSLGDSYSSGEGIEEFYGQNLPLTQKVKNEDWLAHRSTKSWPSLLKIPGKTDTMAHYKVSDDEATSTSPVQWYFAASSGAETIHFHYSQPKRYDKSIIYYDTGFIPPQLSVFDSIQGEVDYVTLTIGGNNVGFADIITTCVMESTYLEFCKDPSSTNHELKDKMDKIWSDIGLTIRHIREVYRAIHDKAPNADIIVAGYPELLDYNGKGTTISKNEATIVNKNVRDFNGIISHLVDSLKPEMEDKIHFVDVVEEFKDHQAYSRPIITAINPKEGAWINPIYFGPILKSEDLTDIGTASAYSIHPNEYGAQAYARCVNAKIAEIENQKAAHTCNITGVVTIADADTDMTNNLPLEGAKIKIDYAGLREYTAVSDANGRYQINNVPVGGYGLTVTREGFIPVFGVIMVSDDKSEIIYNVTIEAVSDIHSGTGYASGIIYDVGTGLGVPGLTLKVRGGIGVTTGDIVFTTTTDSSGKYDIQSGLDAGNYTVEVIDNRSDISENERYTTSSFNIKILGGLRIDNQHGYVSNGLTIADIRIVLSWGAEPLDLDSHLVGPTAEDDSFHIYFVNKVYEDEANLDVDDVSSYGPETITIHKYNNGIYTYAVHDYSNRELSSSSELSKSGAQVNVYRGMELIMTYNVPTGQDGTLWTVFSYDSNTQRFSSINTMSYETKSWEILQPRTYSELPQSDKNNAVLDAQILISNDINENKKAA